MANKFHDIMFTKSVKSAQEHYGARKHYARYEGEPAVFHGLNDLEIDFISSRDSFYIATVNEVGQPYIQHRGGPRGFLKILDNYTLGYADLRGNLQYLTVGNLSVNDRAALFLMDYARQKRLKILAGVEITDAAEAPELIRQLQMPGYNGVVERAVILHIKAVDWNCPQHITQRFTLEEIKQINAPIYEHIEKLEAENARLKELLKEASIGKTNACS